MFGMDPAIRIVVTFYSYITHLEEEILLAEDNKIAHF